MNSEVENGAVEAADQIASADTKEPIKPVVAPAKSKLPMILGLAVLGVGAVLLGRWALDAQVPKGDNQFERKATESQTPGMGRDRSQGFKPPGNSGGGDEATEETQKDETEL